MRLFFWRRRYFLITVFGDNRWMTICIEKGSFPSQEAIARELDGVSDFAVVNIHEFRSRRDCLDYLKKR